MTETVSGEIHWFKPMIGSKTREAYDKARSGEVITGTEASWLAVPYAMDFECVAPRRWNEPAQYLLRGEWHDLTYYPASQVHRIEAEEMDWDEYRQDDEAETDPDL